MNDLCRNIKVVWNFSKTQFKIFEMFFFFQYEILQLLELYI